MYRRASNKIPDTAKKNLSTQAILNIRNIIKTSVISSNQCLKCTKTFYVHITIFVWVKIYIIEGIFNKFHFHYIIHYY